VWLNLYPETGWHTHQYYSLSRDQVHGGRHNVNVTATISRPLPYLVQNAVAEALCCQDGEPVWCFRTQPHLQRRDRETALSRLCSVQSVVNKQHLIRDAEVSS